MVRLLRSGNVAVELIGPRVCKVGREVVVHYSCVIRRRGSRGRGRVLKMAVPMSRRFAEQFRTPDIYPGEVMSMIRMVVGRIAHANRFSPRRDGKGQVLLFGSRSV